MLVAGALFVIGLIALVLSALMTLLGKQATPGGDNFPS
jgi:hypothetical protein